MVQSRDVMVKVNHMLDLMAEYYEEIEIISDHVVLLKVNGNCYEIPMDDYRLVDDYENRTLGLFMFFIRTKLFKVIDCYELGPAGYLVYLLEVAKFSKVDVERFVFGFCEHCKELNKDSRWRYETNLKPYFWKYDMDVEYLVTRCKLHIVLRECAAHGESLIFALVLKFIYK